MIEVRLGVSKKLPWFSGLQDATLVEEDDPVPPSDGVEPVGDGEAGAVGELSPDRLLDLLVRGAVHGGRVLVQHQHLGTSEESSSQADQLSAS